MSSNHQLESALRAILNVSIHRPELALVRERIRLGGVEPGVHTGDTSESFENDPVKTTEWILGQWATVIDRLGVDPRDTDWIAIYMLKTLAFVRSVRTLLQSGPGAPNRRLA